MAKGMGHEQTLSFGGTPLTDVNGGCIVGTSTFSSDIDEAVAACAGGSSKTHYTGLTDSSITFDMAIEKDSETLLGTTLASGATGIVSFDPFGSGASNLLRITSTNGTVGPWSLPVAVNDVITVSFNIKLDDFTITSTP